MFHRLHPINLPLLPFSSTMSKRAGATRTHTTKLKKRRGVGSRSITVLDSDEEDPPAADEYARITRTRVSSSGKAERVSTSSIPIFEAKEANIHTPLENISEDGGAEHVIPVGPAKQKQQKRANDSVSSLTPKALCVLLNHFQTKMYSWLNVLHIVLDDIISLDGPGGRRLDLCALCSNDRPSPRYRCLECSYSSLYCSECIVKQHKALPLHRLEVRSLQPPLHSTLTLPQCWQNGFFNRTSLHSLGLVCHLGHDGDPCPVPSLSRDLIIIDANGWHKVKVGFCACDSKTPRNERYRQLLRMRWYPASFSRPRTAFTFDLLETYHKLTLQGKLNLYDFYLTIMQKSDNQGRLKTMVSNQ